MIPIAVGGATTAFSQRSAKTGGGRGVIPGFRQSAFQSIHHSCRLCKEHPSPDFRGPSAGIGSVDPKAVVVDEHISEHKRLDKLGLMMKNNVRKHE